MIEEKRQHFGKHGMLIVVLENEHLRREDQREVGNMPEIDGLESMKHEFINQIDDLVMKCHVLLVDQEHQGPEDITWQTQIDQLISKNYNLLLEAEKHQLLDHLQGGAFEFLVANPQGVF